jgi:acyl-CoA synthetase (AMP-forming)/AMP-acid ligase II
MGRTALEASAAPVEARLIGPGSPFHIERSERGTRAFVNGPHGLSDLYSRAARNGDRPFLTSGDATWSYDEIFGRALGLARWLQEEGLPGERIGLLLDEPAEWLTWFIAITAAGASCVLPSPGANLEAASALFETAGCESIVAQNSPFMERIAGRQRLDIRLEASPVEQEAIIAFTSGSTGTPKGVRHSQRSLLSGYRNMMLGGAIGAAMQRHAGTFRPPHRPTPATTMLLAPLNYIAGYSAVLLALGNGGHLVVPKDLEDVGELAASIHALSPQALVGAQPPLLRRLIRLPDLSLIASLKRLQLQGASVQSNLVGELAERLPDVDLAVGYGLTETAGAIASAPIGALEGLDGGCGRIVPSADLRVVGADGRILSSGEVGQIEVRGDMVMLGYLDERANDRAFAPDGWLRTGDVGRVEAERWLCVLDRDDNERQQNESVEVYRGAVEDAVRRQPGVDDAVAVLASQDLVLYVQVRLGETLDQSATEAAVRRASGWRGDVVIRQASDFPRTASGKIDRRVLGAAS